MNIKDCTLTKIALLKLIRRLPNAAPVTDRWWPTDHHPNTHGAHFSTGESGVLKGVITGRF
jgi:hypothetical protein